MPLKKDLDPIKLKEKQLKRAAEKLNVLGLKAVWSCPDCDPKDPLYKLVMNGLFWEIDEDETPKELVAQIQVAKSEWRRLYVELFKLRERERKKASSYAIPWDARIGLAS